MSIFPLPREHHHPRSDGMILHHGHVKLYCTVYTARPSPVRKSKEWTVNVNGNSGFKPPSNHHAWIIMAFKKTMFAKKGQKSFEATQLSAFSFAGHWKDAASTHYRYPSRRRRLSSYLRTVYTTSWETWSRLWSRRSRLGGIFRMHTRWLYSRFNLLAE